VSQKTNVLEELIAALPEIAEHHPPTDRTYQILKRVARAEVERIFASSGPQTTSLGPLGTIHFPYHGMGNIDSLDLFGIDELIILSFYATNRGRYRRVLDLGANLGLHSFAMSRCGFEVKAFEPDPRHVAILQETLRNNELKGVTLVQAAVSVEAGTHEFVRVLGNTTGSHLAGAKANPYGQLERFAVGTEPIKPLLAWADLAKIDIEGHEATVLASTSAEDWAGTDAIVEIGNAANADVVFRHFKSIGVGLFAQKIGWSRVTDLTDMPTSHRDGSLFVTRHAAVPWGRHSRAMR
jgi:FkbM family methyltransferase